LEKLPFEIVGYYSPHLLAFRISSDKNASLEGDVQDAAFST
jgi:hypothetical protein